MPLCRWAALHAGAHPGAGRFRLHRLGGRGVVVPLLALSAVRQGVLCNPDEVLFARCDHHADSTICKITARPMSVRQVNTLSGCFEVPAVHEVVAPNDKLKVFVRVQVSGATVSIFNACDFHIAFVAHGCLFLPCGVYQAQPLIRPPADQSQHFSTQINKQAQTTTYRQTLTPA